MKNLAALLLLSLFLSTARSQSTTEVSTLAHETASTIITPLSASLTRSTMTTMGMAMSTNALSSSNTAAITPTSSPVNDTDALYSQLKYIYIIVGVIMVLIVVIIILIAAIGIVCQRKLTKPKKQSKKQPTDNSLESGNEFRPPSTQLSPARRSEIPSTKTSPIRSPARKQGIHKNSQESNSSMSDFPMLCRLIQDYDSAPGSSCQSAESMRENLESSTGSNESSSCQHHSILCSEVSSDLEASVKTTTSIISQDDTYDTLEKVLGIIKIEEEPIATNPSPKTSPKHKVTSLSPVMPDIAEEEEKTDMFGYHVIDIEKIAMEVKRSQSANDIFDDPKYNKLHPVNGSPSSSVPSPLILYKPANFQDLLSEGPDDDHKEVSMKRSISLFTPPPFEKKENKQYMSLQQVMDLVNAKLSPNRSISNEEEEEEDEEEGGEELYCPRVVGPSQQ